MPNKSENNLPSQISILALLLAKKLRKFASETKDDAKRKVAKSLSDEICKDTSVLIK